jgi:hypothetical protein
MNRSQGRLRRTLAKAMTGRSERGVRRNVADRQAGKRRWRSQPQRGSKRRQNLRFVLTFLTNST